MISPLKKIRTTHHILKEFQSFLFTIEKIPEILRIIPGPISRQNKGTSDLRLNFSYPTATGLKYSMIKGSTAQKLDIICNPLHHEHIKTHITQIFSQVN